MQRERPLQSTFSLVSLSFLLHLLCTPNNPAQSLLLCPWRLATFSPACLFLACRCKPHPPLPFLCLAGALFIMLLLNILQPIAPKELVCYNMKIWPHLAKVAGNKHLTRGWADGASNSNLLPAPCWFAVLAGSARFPLPVVSQRRKSAERFISMPLPSSLLEHQIYWYWPLAEIKRVDPWAARAKFKPIKEHFTNQQGKARAVSQAGPAKLKSFALYQNLFTGQTEPK